jgi:cytochrome c
MVGKNLIDLKDVDGKPFVKERVELAQARPPSGRTTSSPTR